MALKNKTIITKKNGSIFIPNKIIRAEYPDSNNSDSDNSNLKIYYVKILVDESVEGLNPVSSSNVGCISLRSYLQNNKNTFKHNLFVFDQYSKCIFIYYKDSTEKIISGRLENIMYYNTTAYKDFFGKELIFLSFNKEHLIEIIDAFNDDIKYETNF